MRILIVDDDAISRDVLARTLEQEGRETISVADGWRALDTLLHSDCQLVITDWLMPEFNGVSLCRTIRGLELGRYIYVIVTSSLSDPRDIVLAVSSGANAFLSKPVNAQELLEEVAQAELTIMAADGLYSTGTAACRA